MIKERKQKKYTAKNKRFMSAYLVVLFAVAFLLLLLAYFMQERAYAQGATQILNMI